MTIFNNEIEPGGRKAATDSGSWGTLRCFRESLKTRFPRVWPACPRLPRAGQEDLLGSCLAGGSVGGGLLVFCPVPGLSGQRLATPVLVMPSPLWGQGGGLLLPASRSLPWAW